MKKLKIACFKNRNQGFISQVTIEDCFLFKYLPEYAEIIPFEVKNKQEMINQLLCLQPGTADYFYLNVREVLLEAFLLREERKLEVPFILMLHSVFGFKLTYPQVVPLIRRYDIVCAPSEYARKSFQRITPQTDVHVVSNCLDLNMIKNSRSRVNNHRARKIVFMGQLVEDKGVDTVIECMPEILNKVEGAHLDIIGPLSGSRLSDNSVSKYVKSLRDTVRELGLDNAVTFTGVKLNKEKYELLSQADVFVSPSVAPYEAQPVVNLEAQACGIPVVTSGWAGNNETVDHGINGLLVTVNKNESGGFSVDKQQLADSIINLLTDEQLNESFREKALKKAEKYDYHLIIQKFIELLEKYSEMELPAGNCKNIWKKSLSNFKHLFAPQCYKYLEAFLDTGESYRSLFYDNLREYMPLPQSEENSQFDPIKDFLSEISLNSSRGKNKDKLWDDFCDYINLRQVSFSD
jgi:glycosyltransferase involved in cell wall biosynthesis